MMLRYKRLLSGSDQRDGCAPFPCRDSLSTKGPCVCHRVERARVDTLGAHHKPARFPWRPKKEQNDGNCTSFQFQTPVIHVLVRLRNANRPIWSCNYAPFDFVCASCLNHRQRQNVFFIRSRSLNLEQRLLDRLWLGMHVRHVIQDTMCTCFRVWFALRNKGKLWTFFWAKP